MKLILSKTIGLFFLSFFLIIQLDAQEICGNGIDDDGNGLIDCTDPACTSGAVPIASAFNTGTNGIGGVLGGGDDDINWQVSIGSIIGPYTPAVVMGIIPGSYFPSPWPDCNWISHDSAGEHYTDTSFYYRIQFYLPCFNSCGASFSDSGTYCLSMDFYADNSVDEVYINDIPQSYHLIGVPAADPYGSGEFVSGGGLSFSLCSGWQPGLNVLIIKVSSSPGNEGFLAQQSTTLTATNDPTILLQEDTICDLTTLIDFTAVSSGGFWTANCGSCIDSLTGEFDPSIAGPGDYIIKYTLSIPCIISDTAMIHLFALADAHIDPVSPLCVNDQPFNLNAATAGGTWSGIGITDTIGGVFNPVVAGTGDHIITYALTSLPCLPMDTVVIRVVEMNASITSAGPFCAGSAAVTLTAIGSSGVWGGIGITNPISGIFNPATAGPGLHIITYTIDSLCSNADSIVIEVLPSPIISFTADTTEGCEPAIITFTSVTDQPGGECLWDFGDGKTSTDCNTFNSYTLANIYPVTFTYTGTTGCSTTVIQNDLITIHSQPNPMYTADPQTATIANPTIHFTDHSTGLINNWNWAFGTGDSSVIQNPVYTYADTGLFPIKFTVFNNFGCKGTVEGTILINGIFSFYAPTAFTPNNNDVNDEFIVKGEGIDLSTFEMKIFDRWGELLYRTEDINRGWNGTINNAGSEPKQDEYIWKVNFRDFSNKQHSYIGHVLLLK